MTLCAAPVDMEWAVARVLNDERSWGVSCEWTVDSGAARFAFYWDDAGECMYEDGTSSDACAPLADNRVLISPRLKAATAYNMLRFAQAVNHEVGHKVLGPAHFGTGVMSADPLYSWHRWPIDAERELWEERWKP